VCAKVLLHSAAIVVALFVTAAGPAWAGLSPSLQFGTLPVAADGVVWEMAIPLDGTVVSLEGGDHRLAVRNSAVDEREWLVFTARAPGPVSALMRIRDAGGRTHAVSIAGEGVPAADFQGLLLRGHVPGAAIERFIRRAGTGLGQMNVNGARSTSVTSAPEGWTRLAVDLPPGVAESDGTLEAGDERYAVHASLLESITVQGAYLFPSNFAPRRVRALEERLQNGRMSARIGVLGQIRNQWWLRSLDAVPEGPTVSFVPAGRSSLIPSGSPDDPAFLARIHHLGGEATDARFLMLVPGVAAIVHPTQGLLEPYEDGSLARLGAARASRLNQNRVYAMTGDGSGEWYLSSLLARRVNGVMGISQVRYQPSLQSLIGGGNLLIGDLASIRYPGPGGIQENLLVSVGTEQGDLRIVELTPNGSTVGAQVRHFMQVTDPRQLPAVQKDVLPSKVAGGGGFPIQVRVAVPGQETRVLRVDAPGSWSFLAREAFPVPFEATGVALGSPHFILAAPNGSGSDLIRYEYAGGILQGRALGTSGATPIDYHASARARHAWLLGRDNATGRGTVRMLTNGLPPGTNLPPVVSAGTDILTSIPRVFLRANWYDGNGDPVGVRWSGDNVEFANRFARQTTARVPRGVSRIMVRAREGGFSAPAGAAGSVLLEDRDQIVVTRQQTTGVDPGGAAGLMTALGNPEPNPASSRTWIPFTLANGSRARVEIFDLGGRRIRTLMDEWLPAGGHDALWDGTHADGTQAIAGIYFVRLAAEGQESQRRIAVVR
jgi:hypothetical protein